MSGGKPILRVLTGAHGGDEYQLPRSRVIIGRELTCGVVFEEPVLSRRHCCIFEENGGFWIADLESK
ncbi:MAG: FHA domain-containing protein, partial [Planctomycetota bacterium]